MGYFGSKATSGLCQPLIAMMPPHSVYIETHLGGGAIIKRKPPALRNIGIDRDARVLDAFECDYPVDLVHGCAHRFLAEFTFEGTELLYCDPPYLKRTRRSKRRYRFDYEDCDHEALLELLAQVPCQVMVSGYASTLYEARLAHRGVDRALAQPRDHRVQTARQRLEGARLDLGLASAGRAQAHRGGDLHLVPVEARGARVDDVQGIGHHGLTSRSFVGGRRRRTGPVALDSHP